MSLDKMIRSNQKLTEDEIRRILKEGTTGVLGLITKEGYPYTVPITYIYDNDKIYFHGAKKGLKFESINYCDKVSFCVIGKDDIIPEELTTYYQSVIIFGKIRIITEEIEIRDVAEKIGLRFLDDKKKINETISNEMKALGCFEIIPDLISGKEAVELSKRRMN